MSVSLEPAELALQVESMVVTAQWSTATSRMKKVRSKGGAKHSIPSRTRTERETTKGEETTKTPSLEEEKRALRNKMLLGWGASVTVAFLAGLHMCFDRWTGRETWTRASTVYLSMFLICFAFATYVDNTEALKPRPAPVGSAKPIHFFRDATPQHYSWLFSIVSTAVYLILKLSGVIQEDLSSAVVWIAPSLIVRLAVGMSAILHRFVSHRAYEPRNRVVQFALCCLGCLAGQGSPVFWGAMHNRHHRHCDTELDPHSPQVRPFWYAWWGWTIAESDHAEEKYLDQLWGLSEMQWLHRYFYIPFLIEYAACWYVFGFGRMLFGCWLPSTLAAGFTLLFNVRSHHPALSELPSSPCKAFNLVDLGAWVVGEAAHLDHHRDPKAYNRVTDQWFGFYDFPYYLFIKPMLVFRLAKLPKTHIEKDTEGSLMVMLLTWAFVGFVVYICAQV